MEVVALGSDFDIARTSSYDDGLVVVRIQTVANSPDICLYQYLRFLEFALGNLIN